LRLQASAADVIVASGASKANATIHDSGFAHIAGMRQRHIGRTFEHVEEHGVACTAQ